MILPIALVYAEIATPESTRKRGGNFLMKKGLNCPM